jgi:hypothetical protein
MIEKGGLPLENASIQSRKGVKDKARIEPDPISSSQAAPLTVPEL